MIIVAVVLAAGASTRLGRPKQLLRWGDETLVRRAVKAALATVGPNVLVVLGAEADRVQSEIADLPVHVVVNTAWRSGMGTSLSAAFKHSIFADTEAEVALLMLCDQPLIDSRDLSRLVAEYQAGGVDAVATEYADGPGVPAVIGSRLFSRLRELGGEQGARVVLRSPSLSVRTMAVPGASLDIDTQADLERLSAAQARSANS